MIPKKMKVSRLVWSGRPLTERITTALAVLFMIFCVNMSLLPLNAPAADENCGSCGYRVSVSGSFKHFKANTPDKIEGGSGDVSAFYEEINGDEFSVSVMNLPAGKYTIIIGEIEFIMEAGDKRIFDVTCGDVNLADHFDIYTAAGGMRKICYITGNVEHTGDELRGP
ncbi:MAG: hypothetical protein JW947_07055, partial [Sedimentisphaerales bacterium]|nr:hypothetical protein [Sedimentisphaerales bacterium]